jgi:two-component system chemotaxis response regulator CheB
MAQQIRVLVVDDSSFMRGALVRMIERDPRFKVVDVAVNGKEAIEKAQALKPDVVTMDVEMPVMNGLEALKGIMATVRTPVVMVSTLTESGAKITMEALEAGAVDFLPKALADKDRNIFRGADDLHEKLLAAAGVSNGRPEKAKEAAMAVPPARVPVPAPNNVQRVPARILLIGSSTGGPKALQVLIQGFPANMPVPVVIAQHMPPQFTQALARRLDETCAPHVVEAQMGETLQAGTIYVAQGGAHMRVTQQGISIDPDRGESPYRPSVDVLAESVHKVFGHNVLGVMLTGMGNDGTREFVNLKKAGAYVIAQDRDSSVVYGMPKAVLEAGGVDEVLSIERISARVRMLLGC